MKTDPTSPLGKTQATSVKLQVQEWEEREEQEKAAAEYKQWLKAEEVATLHYAKELQESMAKEQHRVAENVLCAHQLQLKMEKGKATDYDMAKVVDLLGQDKSPDAKDVLDEELESDDESMDPAVELKPVEGSKKQKRRTVMEGKPQKNRKILEEELE
ncbi:hypothetical protein B0H14DRAFT_3446265 [Mycena olivaceomarginata]|nr:hypothetical protein B0H14DRAFT_3446265 [Mycena olivaceomarginata]